MSHYSNGDKSYYNRRGYTPRRFRSLVKESQRLREANPTEKVNESTNNDPLVRETRRLASVTHQLVIWTGVIAAIGALSFTAALLQWDALRRTDEKAGETITALRDQGTIMQGQWAAMQTTSDLTRESNQISREAFTSVQRAYVIVDDIIITRRDWGEGSPAWSFYPHIRNIGNTQTRNMRAQSSSGDADDQYGPPDPADMFINLYSTETEMKEALYRFYPILAPHSDYKISPSYGAGGNYNTMTKAAAGHVYTVSFGVIYYNDVFPNTPEYITKWCFLMRPIKDAKGDPDVIAFQCPYWNCADDECKDDKARYENRRARESKRLKKP
jgi:hypothetical protein